jgi:hypothetical protein
VDLFGRLIWAGKFRGDPKAVAYIVAIADSADAIEMIMTKVAEAGDQVEGLGRVSDTLIQSLGLSPGEFMRSDASAIRRP